MSATNIEANDLLFEICSDPTLNQCFFFFPGNLVGKNVLFVLLHISVQLFIVCLGSHVIRQQFFLNLLEVSHFFVMDAFKAQDLVVEAGLEIMNTFFKLVFKIRLTFKILSDQLFGKLWSSNLDIIKTAVF